jgi:PAS domain S-box-containing protein
MNQQLDASAAPEQQLHRLNWALAACAGSSSALIHFDNLEDLMAKVCEAIVEQGIYALAWVGLAETSPGRPVRIVAGAGHAIGYLEELKISWSEDVPEGNGPGGRAIRSGVPEITRDFLIEPTYALWREKVRRFEMRSSVSVPFGRNDTVIGVLAVYAPQPDAFGPSELSLFSQLSKELAFAISLDEDRTRLRHAEEQREQLLETLNLASIIVRDLDGTIRFWSKGCESIYGWTAAEACGQRVHDLLSTVFPVPPEDVTAALLRDGLWSGDLLQQRRDGAEITVAASKALRRDAAGTPVAVMESVGDVTALRQAEAELRRVNRDLEARVREEVQAREAAQTHLAQAQKMQALGQLAGGIAHDFNNILQAVAGAATLLERRPADAERVRRVARMLLEASERGAGITSRLLSFSRQSKLKAEPLHAAAVLDGIRQVLEPTLGSPIEVRVVSEPGLPPLLADQGQLETALINLATNARDAMPEGGRLILSVASEAVAAGTPHPANLAAGRYVRISVSDTGAGMDAATLERACEPFFSTKPQGQGTGLGLAMVRGFAEQSRGGLSIASTPGRGTTVTLWLPEAVTSAEAPPVGAEAITEAAGQPEAAAARRILFVDDDELVRETMRAQVEDGGYIVYTASNGQEALALLDAGVPVDVLVTDLAMPGMSGLATIREAQRRRPGLPAVLLTGYAGDRVGLAADDGSFLLLRKPVRGVALLSCIEVAVGKKGAV